MLKSNKNIVRCRKEENMIVCFCGHSDFQKSKEYEQKILSFLYEKVGDFPADMYLGDYGNFDHFSYYDCFVSCYL